MDLFLRSGVWGVVWVMEWYGSPMLVTYLDMDIGEEYVLRAEGMALHRKQSIVAD